jgi:hypothetical protein
MVECFFFYCCCRCRCPLACSGQHIGICRPCCFVQVQQIPAAGDAYVRAARRRACCAETHPAGSSRPSLAMMVGCQYHLSDSSACFCRRPSRIQLRYQRKKPRCFSGERSYPSLALLSQQCRTSLHVAYSCCLLGEGVARAAGSDVSLKYCILFEKIPMRLRYLGPSTGTIGRIMKNVVRH